MEDFASLSAYLNSLKRQLADKKAEKQRYLELAGEVKTVYNRMAEDKDLMKDYRKNVKDFRKEKYDTFKGELYKESYKACMKDLLDAYDVVIGNIDTNMDRLNTKRAEYENKAYACNGPIGYLQSAINSVAHTLENWVN